MKTDYTEHPAVAFGVAHSETDGPRSLKDVVSALALLGLNGDKLFERIREDLERGDRRSARTHLNFVDVMLEKRASEISSPTRRDGASQAF